MTGALPLNQKAQLQNSRVGLRKTVATPKLPRQVTKRTPLQSKRPGWADQPIEGIRVWPAPASFLAAFPVSRSFGCPVMSIASSLRVALGGDHAGFRLKQAVAARLAGQVAELLDCGTHSEESCDYPDFAVAVARELVDGRADRGIVVCGSGVGVSVAANKIPGIRAAICHDTYSAHQGVEHDDMNILCIGGRIIGSELAFEVIDAFLNAAYTGGERHARRLAKVLEIERLGLDSLRHQANSKD